MTTFDNRLSESAKKHMKKFELTGFKRTYPSLYKTFKEMFKSILKENERIGLGDKVITDYYEHEEFEVVGIRLHELELKGDWSGGTYNVSQTSWYPFDKCKKIKTHI